MGMKRVVIYSLLVVGFIIFITVLWCIRDDTPGVTPIMSDGADDTLGSGSTMSAIIGGHKCPGDDGRSPVGGFNRTLVEFNCTAEPASGNIGVEYVFFSRNYSGPVALELYYGNASGEKVNVTVEPSDFTAQENRTYRARINGAVQWNWNNNGTCKELPLRMRAILQYGDEPLCADTLHIVGNPAPYPYAVVVPTIIDSIRLRAGENGTIPITYTINDGMGVGIYEASYVLRDVPPGLEVSITPSHFIYKQGLITHAAVTIHAGDALRRGAYQFTIDTDDGSFTKTITVKIM